MRVLERTFSNNEEQPTVLVANLHISSNVATNLSRMEEVVEVAHRKRANIVIFPELCVTGYVWDDGGSGAVSELLDEGESSSVSGTIQGIHDSLGTDGRGLEYVFYNNVCRKNGAFYNSTFVLNRSIDHNREEYIYDKVFLPPLEQRYFQQGRDKRLTISPS